MCEFVSVRVSESVSVRVSVSLSVSEFGSDCECASV